MFGTLETAVIMFVVIITAYCAVKLIVKIFN